MRILIPILTVILVILIFILIGAIYMWIRNNWVGSNEHKYLDAIFEYVFDEIQFNHIELEEGYRLIDQLGDYDEIYYDIFNWSQEQFVKDQDLFNQIQKYL